MILDLGDGGVRSLVGPYGVHGAFAADRDAVVRAVAFERAVRCVVGALQQCHVDVAARDVLDGVIVGLAQREGAAGVGDDLARDRDDDARGVGLDRDRVVGVGEFDGFCGGHGGAFGV